MARRESRAGRRGEVRRWAVARPARVESWRLESRAMEARRGRERGDWLTRAACSDVNERRGQGKERES